MFYIYHPMKWIACMFHIAQTEFDFICSTLQEYDIGGYIIAHEDSPHSHYHMIFQGTDAIYNAYSKRLIEKYNLRGKAGKDKARQYGRISKIKDLEKLKSYTVKEGNIKTNLSEEEISGIIEKSFKKANTQSLIDEIVESVVDIHKTARILDNSFTSSFEVPAYRFIIKQLINRESKISKSLIRTILIKSIIASDLEDNMKTYKILEIL